MRAVWSLWTLPHRVHRGFPWFSERHHLFSWILSVETARQHFADRALYTDDEGAALLVDGLQLPFTEISTSLNELKDQDPDWWMLGKLHTYQQQQTPFVHLDADVYLWKALPERLMTAPVLAQNPEGSDGVPWYDADLCEKTIRSRGDGWIPQEWSWYRQHGTSTGACCGIVGGNDVDFLRQYSSIVIRILESRRNRVAFDGLGDKKVLNPFFEQYLLCAFAAFRGIRIEYLFDSFDGAVAPGRAAEFGFTHLQSHAKSNAAIAGRLEQRVARDFPETYARCNRLALIPAGDYQQRAP
jgi:hypothetical protein